MCNVPEVIKGAGYIARRDGDRYIMDYLVGGHLPEERTEILTIEDMKTIYENPEKWNEVMVRIETRRDSA